jgi:hypothetical protein
MPATFASLRLLSIFSASDPGWRPPKAGGYFSSSSALGLDDQAVFLPELREIDVFRSARSASFFDVGFSFFRTR